MRRTAPALTAALLPLLLGSPLAGPAAAAPTCYAPVPLAACSGRVVAEPQRSTSFHQFDGPLESLRRTLEEIEKRSPGFLEVGTVADFTGDPSHQSKAGRPLWVVRVTDESVKAPKKQVAASLSVHGLEAAGREGGLRYLEDLALQTAALPGVDKPMHAGDVAVPTSRVMRETEAWFAFTNADGWAAGDLDSTSGPGFERGNESGLDLNRDYATVGWYDRTRNRGVAESEPETRGWVALVEGLEHLTTSTDIHGELDTPNEAFADLIVPAGQWTPERQAQVGQLGDHMIRTIERKFAEEGVLLDEVFGPLPGGDGATPRRPANVAASYDIVGYDDSGFMGDWFSQRQDSVHMDVENFLSNLAPNNAFSGAVEQAHVAAVRGILEATVVEALLTDDVEADLQMGRVAYVGDPVRTSSRDGNGRGAGSSVAPQLAPGETPVDYDVSRLEYFEALERTVRRPVDEVSADRVVRGDLSRYDSLVVADMELPADSAVTLAQYVAGLKAFAERGGQLVLTDRAVRLLDDLGLVPTSALTVNRTDAGHVDFVGALGDHPWEKGLVGKPSQTYYEVLLGFPSRSSSPNHGVERGAWERAGGTTVATVGAQGASSSPNTALGHLPLGRGRVAVFGAILPQAVEELVREDGSRTITPHPFGLADYAVTITGGQVLDNVLAYRGAALPGPAAVERAEEEGSPSLLSRVVARADVLWRDLTEGSNR